MASPTWSCPNPSETVPLTCDSIRNVLIGATCPKPSAYGAAQFFLIASTGVFCLRESKLTCDFTDTPDFPKCSADIFTCDFTESPDFP